MNTQSVIRAKEIAAELRTYAPEDVKKSRLFSIPFDPSALSQKKSTYYLVLNVALVTISTMVFSLVLGLSEDQSLAMPLTACIGAFALMLWMLGATYFNRVLLPKHEHEATRRHEEQQKLAEREVSRLYHRLGNSLPYVSHELTRSGTKSSVTAQIDRSRIESSVTGVSEMITRTASLLRACRDMHRYYAYHGFESEAVTLEDVPTEEEILALLAGTESLELQVKQLWEGMANSFDPLLVSFSQESV